MATFGKLTTGATNVTDSNVSLVMSSATPTSTGIVQSITTNISVTSGSAIIRGAIYTDNSGSPDTLLAYTDPQTITNTTNQAITIPFGSGQQKIVAANIPYWIGINWQDPGTPSVVLLKDSVTNGRLSFSTATLPAIIIPSLATQFSGPIDAYVTYSEAGKYSLQKSAIVSILQSNITTANVVYNFVERNPSGYPTITVEYYDGTGEFADTGRNRRSRIYRITCSQERVKVGANDAERILGTLIDQIIGVFDDRANITLNNTCDFAYPIPGKWGYIQAPDIDVRTAEILLETVTLE